MAGGYAVPAVGDLAVLVQRLKALESRVRELERPSGSQDIRSVELLRESATYSSVGGEAKVDLTVPTSNRVDYSGAPSVTFTVSRSMRAQISVSASSQSLVAAADTTAEVVVEAYGGATRYVLLFEKFKSGAPIAQTRNGFASAVIVFPAGEHTITTKGYAQLLDASATDKLFAFQITLTVAILGEA